MESTWGATKHGPNPGRRDRAKPLANPTRTTSRGVRGLPRRQRRFRRVLPPTDSAMRIWVRGAPAANHPTKIEESLGPHAP